MLNLPHRRALLSGRPPNLGRWDASQGVLPPWISVARAGLGMLIDANSKLAYCPNNLLYSSDTFTGSQWAPYGAAPPIIWNKAISGQADPLGGSNAWLLNRSNGSGILQTPSAVWATNSMASLWVRASSGTVRVNIWGQGSDNSDSFSVTVGTSWTLINSLGAAAVSQIGKLRYLIIGWPANTDLYVYGAGLSSITYESTARPNDRTVTTSAYWYGERYDYTSGRAGLLLEAGRTNLLKYSSFPGSGGSGTAPTGWAPTGAQGANPLAVTQSVVLGNPTGVVSYRRINGSSGYEGLQQSVSISAATTYTFAVYVRIPAGVTPTDLAVYNSTVTRTIATAAQLAALPSNTWVRLSTTWTQGTADTFLSIASSYPQGVGTGWDIAMPDFKASAFADSYIPTAASAVARASDVVTVPAPYSNVLGVVQARSLLTGARTRRIINPFAGFAGDTDEAIESSAIYSPSLLSQVTQCCLAVEGAY